MVSKQIAAVFAILGGVFYLFGSFLGGALFGSFVGFTSGLRGFSNSAGGSSLANAGAAALTVIVFGAFIAIMIIVGGALLNSDQPTRRKAGGALALVMMVLGAVPDVAGFGIGFIFVLIGSILGLTYKTTSPDLIIDMPQMQPVYATQGQQVLASPSGGQFCVRCGKQLYEGAQYCKFCGSPVPR